MNTPAVHHILSYAKLAAVLGALLVLTLVTIGVSYIDMGFFNVPVALAVATTKVTLVLLFFMHLKYEGPVIRYSFIATLTFLAIAIGFVDLFFVGRTIINQAGQAVPVFILIMATYLGISLITSAIMNIYNKRVQLVER